MNIFNEDEAAITIQKWFRMYLQKSHNGGINSSLLDENDNNLEEKNEIDLKLQTQEILKEINLFYKKVHLNLQKKRQIKALCFTIDEISSNLKELNKLEQCNNLETSLCKTENTASDETKKKHQQQIKQMNLKWWEKLDIYEDF